MKREELYDELLKYLDLDYDGDIEIKKQLKRHLFRSDINAGIIVCRSGVIVSQEIEVPLLDGEYFVTITPKE